MRPFKLSVASIIALLVGFASPALAQYTFTTLASFQGAPLGGVGTSNGWDPLAGVTLVGSTLYGTTVGGGVYGTPELPGGNVFSLPITGGTPTSLANFIQGPQGNSTPLGNLIVVGSTIYGTTEYDGL